MKLATAALVSSGFLLALGSDVVFRRQTYTTPTIVLEITNPEPIAVCSSLTISWVYLGPNATMTLQITNNNVSQQGSTLSSASLSQTLSNNLPTGIPPANPITITLATNISPTNPSYFIWNPVNLGQGTYIANATFPSYQSSDSSQSFVIQASNDTSCLSPATTPSATSSSATSTSSGTDSTGFPVRTSPSSSTNTGAIAGGVVGGVVFVLLVLAFYVYFLRSKRTGRRAPASHNGGGRAFGTRQKGWGGLSSFDSSHGAPTYGARDIPQRQRSKLRSSKMHSNADSTRQRQSVGVGEAAVNGPNEAETRHRSANRFSPSKEKFSSSEEIVGMTTLAANGGKRQSDLTVSSCNDHGFNGAVSGPRRWPSVNSTASLPVGARRPSIDSPHTPYVTPASVSTSQLPSSATESALVVDPASQQDRKKTPRKPVPVYAPSPPPQYVSPFPSDDFAPRIPSLVIPPINFDPEADAKQKRASGHYSVASRGPATEQQLHHKSSFGIEGKPLHYLVPDMPLPPTA